MKMECTAAINQCLENGKLFEAIYILDLALLRFPTSRYLQRWVATVVEAMDTQAALDAVPDWLMEVGEELAALYDQLIETFTPHHGPDAPRPGSEAFLKCVIHKNMCLRIPRNQPVRNVLSRFAEHHGRVSAGEAFGVPAAPALVGMRTAKIGLGGKNLRYHVSNVFLNGRFQYFYLQEPGLLRLISRIGKDDIFLDIGANVGIFAIAAAVTKGCRVFAVEPFSFNFNELGKNISLNGAGDRVTALQVAISDMTAERGLSHGAAYIGAASQTFDEPSGRDTRNGEASESVKGYRLDDLIAAGMIAFPTHMKIDVDGTEHGIIAGMPKTLSDWRLRSIRLEIRLDDARNAEALRRIESAGFDCRVDDDSKNILCLRGAG